MRYSPTKLQANLNNKQQVEIAGKVLLDSKAMEILLRVLYLIRKKLESQTSIHLIFWHKRSLRIII